MSKGELVKRYAIFLAGLVCNAFGVAFVTKANLGTSPIASIPYSLSMILPALSLGTWVVIFNVGLVMAQWAVEGKKANRVNIAIEVVMAFCFGYGVDLSMLVLQGLDPQSYPAKLAALLVGCVIIALGAYLEVAADVAMLAGDGFIRALSAALGRQFGTVRVISDISMSAIAAVLCLVFLHELSGVREGTVIAALVIGNLVKVITRLLRPLARRLFPWWAKQ